MRSSLAVSLVLSTVIALLSSGPVAAEDAHSDTVDVAKTPMQLVCVTDSWAVWKTTQLVEETRGHVAEAFVYRFYRQRLAELQASFVATTSGTGGLGLVSVMPDGTVVLFHGDHQLSMYLPDGGVKQFERPGLRGEAAKVESVGLLWVVAAYPDGLLLQDTTGVDPKPVDFLPFRGYELDMQKKVEVVPAAGKPDPRLPRDERVAMSYSWRELPIRHGDTLAWIGDSALHVYNLRDGQRSQIPLAVRMHPAATDIAAFDGETVVVGGIAFDARTGRVVAQNVVVETRNPFTSFAFPVHKRIAYYFLDGHLMAADLMSPSAPPKELIDAEENPVAETDKGLIVWNGKSWSTVAWLERRQHQ